MHTRFQTKLGKVYTRFQIKTAQNPYILERHIPIFIREYPQAFFKAISPLTLLQKGLNLGERPNPLFHLLKFCLCVCYIIGVS